MTPENFCYWLQGFIEMTDARALTEDQVKMVREHLKLVFEKVTPSTASPFKASDVKYC